MYCENDTLLNKSYFYELLTIKNNKINGIIYFKAQVLLYTNSTKLIKV